MPYFNRFDIVEAHYWYCVDYHGGQASALYARLCRIERYFRPGATASGPTTNNAQEIYDSLRERAMVAEVAELLRGLRADATERLDVTIASDDGGTWVYQTGDNSYTGACYHYAFWGVGSVARDDSDAACADEAARMVSEVFDALAEARELAEED